MNVEVKTEGNVTRIFIHHESLTRDVAGELKTKVVEAIDQGECHLEMDLSEPRYIDSSGIGKLLFINKKIEMLAGSFRIVKINDTLYQFLDSLAITRVIDIAKPS